MRENDTEEARDKRRRNAAIVTTLIRSVFMREAQTFLDSEHRVRKRTGAGRCIRGESDARLGRQSRDDRKVCWSR